MLKARETVSNYFRKGNKVLLTRQHTGTRNTENFVLSSLKVKKNEDNTEGVGNHLYSGSFSVKTENRQATDG